MAVLEQKVAEKEEEIKKNREKTDKLQVENEMIQRDLELKNSALKKVKKEEFKGTFVQNEVVGGQIDYQAVREWQRRDDSESGSDDTSQEDNSVALDNPL